MTLFEIIITILKSLIIIVPVLIAVAFFTLFERKVMAGIQRRRGPNVVGLVGVLQPFADGLKLLIKETIIPSKANKVIFIIAPVLTLFLSFLSYTVIPFSLFNVFSDLNVGVLYIFAISSLGVYGIIMSG
jgi:NADH-quinone oxidoreductase subunit H